MSEYPSVVWLSYYVFCIVLLNYDFSWICVFFLIVCQWLGSWGTTLWEHQGSPSPQALQGPGWEGRLSSLFCGVYLQIYFSKESSELTNPRVTCIPNVVCVILKIKIPQFMVFGVLSGQYASLEAFEIVWVFFSSAVLWWLANLNVTWGVIFYIWVYRRRRHTAGPLKRQLRVCWPLDGP